ncbi:MFS transporter [Micromonospora sp. NPDC050417]|uniref:MFS transporter n=1 Tax=Micromonospora sp. NPDC050417 TaxID=3364280 RepID=UPI0037B97265
MSPRLPDSTSLSQSGFGLRFIAPVLIGPVLNPINTTMIAVALVPIARDFGIASSTVIWLVSGLYLASSVAQPTMGKLADLLGPKRIYLVGLVLVLVGGLLPVLDRTFAGVVAARVLIGVGTSAAYPSALTLIRDRAARLDVPTPPALLSAISIASLTIGAVGPVLGGVLIEALDWRAIFLVNVPLAILAMAMSVFWLPSDRTRPAVSRDVPLLTSIDPVGILLFAGTIAALLVFLLDPGSGHWWLPAVAILLAGLLAYWELRRPKPFLDLRMLGRNAALSRTYARLFLVYFSVYSMTYGFSQWLQGAAGFSSDTAGFLQLPTALLAGVASLVIARATALRRPLVLAGLLPCLGGLFLVTLTSGAPVWLLLGVAALFGVPQGLASVANQAALYRQAPADQLGVASGLSRTSIYLGAIVSSGVIGLTFGDRPTDGGIHTIGWLIIGATGVAALLALVDRTLGAPERRATDDVPAGVGPSR